MVSLSNLYCFGSEVFLVVDTTAPLPRSQSKSSKMNLKSENTNNDASPSPTANQAKTVIPEEDSLGPVSNYVINFKSSQYH